MPSVCAAQSSIRAVTERQMNDTQITLGKEEEKAHNVATPCHGHLQQRIIFRFYNPLFSLSVRRLLLFISVAFVSQCFSNSQLNEGKGIASVRESAREANESQEMGKRFMYSFVSSMSLSLIVSKLV